MIEAVASRIQGLLVEKIHSQIKERMQVHGFAQGIYEKNCSFTVATQVALLLKFAALW